MDKLSLIFSILAALVSITTLVTFFVKIHKRIKDDATEETEEKTEDTLPFDQDLLLSGIENATEVAEAKKTRKIDSCFDILEMFVFAPNPNNTLFSK